MEGDYFTPKLRLFVLGGNNWNSLVRHALQPVCVCALVFFLSLQPLHVMVLCADRFGDGSIGSVYTDGETGRCAA